MAAPARKRTTDLALHGGAPVRSVPLPYGRQTIRDCDVDAVTKTLRSALLTTGPAVEQFEQAVCRKVGAQFAVAVSSGTAALHAACHAIGIGPGDEVIVPVMTFAATANAVAMCGATPRFADVEPRTLLLNAESVRGLISPKTKAVIAVDYAGLPCEYEALSELCRERGLTLLADACHSLGGALDGKPVGSLADVTIFSFHPVKQITTGEGGMLVTSDEKIARRARQFRNHGITTDVRQREERGTWFYEMAELGHNYRLSDLQCSLGLSQLPAVDEWVEKRRQVAAKYDAAFRGSSFVRPLGSRPSAKHAYHLYVIELKLEALSCGRDEVFSALRAEGIGAMVHYIPVHLHPYYRRTQGTDPGLCPVAERAYARILSLPIFPSMTDADATDVLAALKKIGDHYGK